MKPRRLESETIVSSSATAGATSSGATSLGSVVGRVTGGASERASGPGMAGREDWGPDASRARSIRHRSGLDSRASCGIVRSFDRHRSIDRQPRHAGHGEVRDGVRDRGTAAGGLHLQRAVPVLGRRGPGLQDVRHRDRLGHRAGLDRRRERRWADDGGLGPHPEEHPDPEVVEGRRVRRRARHQRAGRRAAQALHRTARWRDRRPRGPDR